MEQPESNENAAIESVEAREASPVVTSARSVAGPVTTQAGAPGCPTCGSGRAWRPISSNRATRRTSISWSEPSVLCQALTTSI